MRKVMRRRVLTALAAGSVAALLLSGCAGSNNGSGQGGEDARIRVARSFAPTAGLSPYSDDATTLSKFGTAETLVQLSDDLKVEPLLATEFAQTDDLTWTFTLRSGVTFHDGQELTPQDVVTSLTEVRDNADYRDSARLANVTTIAADGQDIVLTLSAPDSTLLWNLTGRAGLVFKEGDTTDR